MTGTSRRASGDHGGDRRTGCGRCECWATISEDHQQLLDTATRIAARYMGPDRPDEFGQHNSAPGGIVLRLRPTRVVSAFKLQERDR